MREERDLSLSSARLPQVGCSLTLVGDLIYLFGGRLVPTRTMVSTLYSLSLRTLVWTLLWPPPAAATDGTPAGAANTHPNGPVPRYFHSAEAWGNKIVVFGGEGYAIVAEGGSPDTVPLRTLGDVCIWDTEKNAWEFPELTCAEGLEPPAPRYAHLGVVSSFLPPPTPEFHVGSTARTDREQSLLIVMGGQDIRNTCEQVFFRQGEDVS